MVKIVVVTSEARTITADAEDFESAAKQVVRWSQDTFYRKEGEGFFEIFFKGDGCGIEKVMLRDLEEAVKNM